MSDKTEEPTPKKLRKAQEEGNSPISSFASQAVAFLCAVAVAPAAIAALTTESTTQLRSVLARAGERSTSLTFDPIAMAVSVVRLTTPILVAAGIAAAVASVVQSGGIIATKRLRHVKDRISRIGAPSWIKVRTRM